LHPDHKEWGGENRGEERGEKGTPSTQEQTASTAHTIAVHKTGGSAMSSPTTERTMQRGARFISGTLIGLVIGQGAYILGVPLAVCVAVLLIGMAVGQLSMQLPSNYDI
jgi:F0F1-type ATP synthase assembly protein I